MIKTDDKSSALRADKERKRKRRPLAGNVRATVEAWTSALYARLRLLHVGCRERRSRPLVANPERNGTWYPATLVVGPRERATWTWTGRQRGGRRRFARAGRRKFAGKPLAPRESTQAAAGIDLTSRLPSPSAVALCRSECRSMREASCCVPLPTRRRMPESTSFLAPPVRLHTTHIVLLYYFSANVHGIGRTLNLPTALELKTVP